MPKKPKPDGSEKKTKPENNNQTALLAVIVIMLAILIIVVLTLKPPAQAPDQAKIASVPAEIKTQQQATTLEKDTSSILQEVSGTLNSINLSLPDV